MEVLCDLDRWSRAICLRGWLPLLRTVDICRWTGENKYIDIHPIWLWIQIGVSENSWSVQFILNKNQNNWIASGMKKHFKHCHEKSSHVSMIFWHRKTLMLWRDDHAVRPVRHELSNKTPEVPARTAPLRAGKPRLVMALTSRDSPWWKWRAGTRVLIIPLKLSWCRKNVSKICKSLCDCSMSFCAHDVVS